MIKAVLFDLDGTLLPMDQDKFLKAYFGGISSHLAPYGYEPVALIKSIQKGTLAMLTNDGTKTNECAFWNAFTSVWGEGARNDEKYFDEFYSEKFPSVKSSCACNPKSHELIDLLHQKGIKTALATNPLFPAVATHERIRWAGLRLDDFEIITTYENSCYCKPNPEYYKAVARAIGVSPEECLMVGNDVSDDMPARTLGMQVFLLTECLINAKGEDISKYPNGDFDALFDFINKQL